MSNQYQSMRIEVSRDMLFELRSDSRIDRNNLAGYGGLLINLG